MTVEVTTIVFVTAVDEPVDVDVWVVVGPVLVVVVVDVVVEVVVKPGMPSATAVTETMPNVIVSTIKVRMSILNTL